MLTSLSQTSVMQIAGHQCCGYAVWGSFPCEENHSYLQAPANAKHNETAAEEANDEGLWGREPPSRVAATGLKEDPREHHARVRRYLCYYLQLLARAEDADTLYFAVVYLRKVQSSHSGLLDILR